MYSRALLLTSTRASPADARVALHTSALSLAHTARRTEPPIRHVSTPSASDAAEKPEPCTVRGVPPSASAAAGVTALTSADGWYVYETPLGAYCWPFTESSTDDDPAKRTGVTHSSCDSSTYRASTGADALPNAQRSVYASRKPPPSNDTRVPPRSGPSGGAAPLATIAPW